MEGFNFQQVLEKLASMTDIEFIKMYNKVVEESHAPELKIIPPYYWNCHGCANWNGDIICRSCINNPFSMSGTRENKWTWDGIYQDCKNQVHHIRVPMEYENDEFEGGEH